MNFITLLIKNEYRWNYKKILIGLFFNIVGTGLLYAAFVPCLGKILPRIDYLELTQYMFPGIIIFLNAMLALGLTSSHTARFFWNGTGDYHRTAGLAIPWLYGSYLVLFGTLLLIHLMISSFTLAILSGFSLQTGALLAFWAYSLLGLILFIQIGILIGLSPDQRNHFYWIILVILPVFLMSGMITPTHYLTGFARLCQSVMPSAILIEGGRSILAHGSLNIFNVFYLLILNIFFFIGVLYLFKRKLQR
ncbi:MAG: ABC transporter permease [Candidatus Neomarinimicrobiota bacterium]